MSAVHAAVDTSGSDGHGVALLAARGMSVGYGPIPVIRDLTVSLFAGEVVALLGPNGAGKTTTLRGLAGELPLTSGHVSWLGRDTHEATHVRCRNGLGVVHEERSVIRGLSVHDNLRLARGNVERAYDLFPELTRLMKRKAGLLSGGEQQILTLARALSRDPKCLLVDELSLGLAPLITERLLAAVSEAASRGVGVLLVEQQVVSALRVSHRAYVLRRGQVVLQGNSPDLLNRLDEIEQSYLVG